MAILFQDNGGKGGLLFNGQDGRSALTQQALAQHAAQMAKTPGQEQQGQSSQQQQQSPNINSNLMEKFMGNTPAAGSSLGATGASYAGSGLAGTGFGLGGTLVSGGLSGAGTGAGLGGMLGTYGGGTLAGGTAAGTGGFGALGGTTASAGLGGTFAGGAAAGGTAAGGAAAGGAAGGAAAGGSAAGGIASGGPWALLAAAIVGNEVNAKKKGRRSDDNGQYAMDLISGKVMEQDSDHYSEKVGGIGGKVMKVGGKMGNPEGVFDLIKGIFK